MDGVLQNTLNPQDHIRPRIFPVPGHLHGSAARGSGGCPADVSWHYGPGQVREYLVASATRVKDGTPEQYGAGIVNAAEAMNSVVLETKNPPCRLCICSAGGDPVGAESREDPSEKVPVNLETGLIGLASRKHRLLLSRLHPARPSPLFLSHSLPEWPLGTAAPNSLPTPQLLSALPALLVMMVCYPWKRLIPFAWRFGVATAVFLAGRSLFPTTGIASIPGRLLESGWLAAERGTRSGFRRHGLVSTEISRIP